MTVTVTGLIGATLTVTATTADDAIWLIPYLRSGAHGWLHGFLFVATLEILVLICVIASHALVAFISEEWILSAAGAGFCWLIAIGLFVKKWLKKRKRRLQQEALVEEQIDATIRRSNLKQLGYGAIEETSGSEAEDDDETIPFSPITVMSLTFVGALDELSYFPALLVGGVFSAPELCLGTALAAVLILIVVSCCLTKCQPLLDCLDQIPLYAVVAFFAAILTIETMLDFVSDE